MSNMNAAPTETDLIIGSIYDQFKAKAVLVSRLEKMTSNVSGYHFYFMTGKCVFKIIIKPFTIQVSIAVGKPSPAPFTCALSSAFAYYHYRPHESLRLDINDPNFPQQIQELINQLMVEPATDG